MNVDPVKQRAADEAVVVLHLNWGARTISLAGT